MRTTKELCDTTIANMDSLIEATKLRQAGEFKTTADKQHAYVEAEADRCPRCGTKVYPLIHGISYPCQTCNDEIREMDREKHGDFMWFAEMKRKVTK